MDLVYHKTSPKVFNGVSLTGPILVQLLEEAVRAANSPEGLPVLGSVWQNMVEGELRGAAAAATAAYNKATEECGMEDCRSKEAIELMHRVSSSWDPMTQTSSSPFNQV